MQIPFTAFSRLLAFAALWAITAPHPLAAQDKPSENVGLSVETIGDMPLADQFTVTTGRDFRMRVISVAPGGIIAYHSHGDPVRPSLEYVLFGTGIEHRDGNPDPTTYSSGKVMEATIDVSHWWENPGKTSLIILAIDIYCTTNTTCP